MSSKIQKPTRQLPAGLFLTRGVFFDGKSNVAWRPLKTKGFLVSLPS
jgi:hypothetical protein